MARSPHGVRFDAHRPVVMGRNGMVAAGHPLAAQAGMSILQKGGNAVDAAIATAAALNVVEPMMSGIGGDGFAMIYWKARDEIAIANGTGAAPFGATRERYAAHGIPFKGILSVSVPGLVAAWLAAYERYASLRLEELLAPAVELAAEGFPVSHFLSRAIAEEASLRDFPTSCAVFTRDGRPPAPGEILRQKELAETLRKLAAGGAEAFYRGEIARSLARFSEAAGGLLTLDDLAACRARWEEPISTTYRGYTVYEAPPNSSGITLLEELNLIEPFALEALGCNTAESLHLMIEAKKLAFIDREAYVADPDHVAVPLRGLLSKAYARERAAAIDLERAREVAPGDPWRHERSEETTCFLVADREGNAVCQLQSLQSPFGSGLVAGETGILLNNRMTYWNLEPGHPNCLQPGKRVRHTMNPVMIFDERGGRRRPVLVCGTPGADTQLQTNLQLIAHVLDFGMTVSEAVEAPRWRHTQNPTESTIPYACRDEVILEERFPAEVRAGLERRGHAVAVIGPWEAAGSAMMIWIDPASGAFHGAADPRRDGYVVAW